VKRGVIAAGGTLVGITGVLLLNPAAPAVQVAAANLATVQQAPTTSASPAPSTSTDPGLATGAGGNSSTDTQSGSQAVTGSAIQTRWGPVQIAATIDNGQLTSVQLLQLPSGDPHSASISQYSGPMLVEQALAAQSANVDGVSGATYTSDGFRRSLQSALTEAGL